jgi:hypothetical protein
MPQCCPSHEVLTQALPHTTSPTFGQRHVPPMQRASPVQAGLQGGQSAPAESTWTCRSNTSPNKAFNVGASAGDK